MTATQAPPKAWFVQSPLQSLRKVKNKLMTGMMSKPHLSCFDIQIMMHTDLLDHRLFIVVCLLPIRYSYNGNWKGAGTHFRILPQASEGDCPPMLRGVFESHLCLSQRAGCFVLPTAVCGHTRAYERSSGFPLPIKFFHFCYVACLVVKNQASLTATANLRKRL